MADTSCNAVLHQLILIRKNMIMEDYTLRLMTIFSSSLTPRYLLRITSKTIGFVLKNNTKDSCFLRRGSTSTCLIVHYAAVSYQDSKDHLLTSWLCVGICSTLFFWLKSRIRYLTIPTISLLESSKLSATPKSVNTVAI